VEITSYPLSTHDDRVAEVCRRHVCVAYGVLT
jgi:hypothetical protein